MLVAQNHPKGMFLTRIMSFAWSFVAGNESFSSFFVLFLAEKRLVFERCLFFVRHSSIRGWLSMMSLSSSILSIIISDDKDDNDDDTRGEKELRPPRTRAAV